MKKNYLKLVRFSMRSIRHPRLRHRGWWKTLTRPVTRRELWIPCRDTVANGLAIGLFFSMILMPFQMPVAALVAIRARANVPFAVAACWISNPVTFPALIWGQCSLGDWMRDTLGIPMPDMLSHDMFNIPEVGPVNSASLMLGMITMALLAAALAYPIVHLFAAVLPHHLPTRRKKVAESGEPPTPVP